MHSLLTVNYIVKSCNFLLCTQTIYNRGWTTIQGYSLSDSGVNDIAVRGNIAAGRSSTRNSRRGQYQRRAPPL